MKKLKMRNKYNAIFLAILLAFSIPNVSFADSQVEKNKDRINQINREVKSKQNIVSSNNTKINNARSQERALKNEIYRLNSSINKLQGEYNVLQDKYEALLRAIGKNESQIKQSILKIQDSSNQIEVNKNQYENRIKTIDTLRKSLAVNKSGILDSTERSKRNQDISKVLEFQASKIKGIEIYKKSVEKSKQNIEVIKQKNLSEADKIKAARADLQAKQRELNSAKSQKDSVVSKLRSLQASLNRENVKLNANIRALIRERQRLEAQIQAIIAKSGSDNKKQNTHIEYIKGTGELSWPIRGQVVVAYGTEKVPGLKSNGIEIRGSYGQAVHSADRGTVIYSGHLSNLGQVVIIDHGGIVTVYGNLKTSNVQKGSKVQKGQTIGTLGIDNTTHEPRLYFETRKGINSVNPLSFL